MNITITGGAGPLARAAADGLAELGRVRLLSARPGAGSSPPRVEWMTGDLRLPAVAAEALAGEDVLVHLDPLLDDGDEVDRLDRASRGTFVLMEAARAAGIRRVVLGSSLDLFDSLPSHWRVSESWRPRPRPAVGHLAPWLAELSCREFSRLPGSPEVVCLRLADLTGSPAAGDAVRALQRAVGLEEKRPGWSLYHVTRNPAWQGAAFRPPFELELPAAAPSPAAPSPGAGEPAPVPSRPLRRIVIFGAGGPLAAEVAAVLAPRYLLRLTDIRPIAEIHREGKRQSPNAPLPEPLGSPHEMALVDVTDAGQVEAACSGMDAILNCTVVRHDPVEAFRVNTLGVFNIARAAAANRIRRIVQTGPQLVTLTPGEGYTSDYDVPGDAPPRPGAHLYGHSKYLGQEILRVFADRCDLQAAVLLFCIFVNPERDDPGRPLNPFSVSWRDAAEAIRGALEVPGFPSAYEVMNVLTDLPHGRFTNERARRLLHWQPRDRLERLWQSPPAEPPG